MLVRSTTSRLHQALPYISACRCLSLSRSSISGTISTRRASSSADATATAISTAHPTTSEGKSKRKRKRQDPRLSEGYYIKHLSDINMGVGGSNSTTTTSSSSSSSSSTKKRGHAAGFVPAEFWRGGTSNGVMLLGSAVPGWSELKKKYVRRGDDGGGGDGDGDISAMLKAGETTLAPFFGAIFGSPDKYGRQLNGMGGGLSSLSKAMIVDVAEPMERQGKNDSVDVDVDYCFVQIGIKDGKLDLQGNCGNMTSAVAPFALNNRLLDLKGKINWRDDDPGHRHYVVWNGDGQATKTHRATPYTVKLRNLNTMKRIDAEIELSEMRPTVRFQEHGNYMMDGVPGFGSPITLSFLSPAGAKTGKAMPTGNPVDELDIQASGKKIRASLLDISNPGVFVAGQDLGWDPSSTPEQLNDNKELMATLESIRQEGAKRMGLDPETQTIPKIVMLFPPASEDVDITCQAISMQQAHKAVPVTHALNLGVACKLKGTIAHELARSRDPVNTVVGHPSGKLEVGADISANGEIVSAKLVRTARCLMEGYANTASSAQWLLRGADNAEAV